MRPTPWHHRLSLKAKLSALSMAITLLIVVLMTSLMLLVQQQDVQRSVSTAQRTLLEGMAADLDMQLEARREALTLQASVLARVDVTEDLPHFFSTRPTFRGMFDLIIVADRNGRILFNSPHLAGRIGRPIADRSYFQQALRSGGVVLSQPLLEKTSRDPSVAMAIALRNPEGDITGVLVGMTVLTQDNYLSHIGRNRLGNNGYFYLLDRSDTPTVVMHPRRDRLLAPPADLGRNVAHAVTAAEETREAKDEAGIESLFSYRPLRSAPWVLGSVYPTEEAYAALHERRREILAISAVLIAVFDVLLWGATARLLRPLGVLQKTMQQQLVEPDTPLPASAEASRELAAVARAFRELMHSRQAFEQALRLTEERTRLILTDAPDAFIGMGTDGSITEWNRQAELTLGWTREEALGRNLAELIIPAAMREGHTRGMQAFTKTGTGPVIGKRLEVTAVHREGHEIPVQLSVAAVREGEAYVANAFLHDISHRREVARRLEASERRLREITANLPALIAYVDREHRYQFCNKTYETWYGVDPLRVIGMHVREAIDNEFYEKRRTGLDTALAGHRWETDLETDTRQGRRHVHIQYLPDVDSDGQVQGCYALTIDITAQKAAEAELQAQARIDTLTGLPNRRCFNERLTEALARSRRSQHAMALLFLDVDHFKQINDTLGHAAGDQVLKTFAARLKDSVRNTDTVARLAGDEFTVILEGLHNAEEPHVIARKILENIRQPILLPDRTLEVGTSIGVAFSDASCTEAELTAKADDALYEAKRAGRNTYRMAQG